MQIQKLKLYHYPATRSARVKWTLHEVVGNDFEVEKVDLYGAKQYTPDFTRFNPNHNLPVLEITWDNGQTQHMLESAAIVTFLADAFPEAQLAPSPVASAQRASYLHMLHFASTWMDMMLWQIRIHEHILSEAARDERTVARYRKKFKEEVEPQIAPRLEGDRFICGEQFTAADCVMGHSVMWARGYGLCRDDVFRGYLSRLSKRPAFIAAFADAKEFSPDARQAAIATRFTG